MSSVSTSGRPAGKVLLTGASGHLGANLLRRLIADGHDVRVLLRPSSDNSSVDGTPVERIYGDLRDPQAVDRAVRGCQRIFHTAAKVSTLYGNAALKREILRLQRPWHASHPGFRQEIRCRTHGGHGQL